MEVGFEVSYAQAKPSVAHYLFLGDTGQDTELSAPSLAPCLPARCHASHHDDDDGVNL